MFYRYEKSRRIPVDLDNMFKGQTCFLLGGAPELKEHAESLQKAKIVTMAMNNTATVVHPTMWIGADKAMNYSPSVLMDPSIMKFNYYNITNPSRLMSKPLGTETLMRDLANMFWVCGESKMDFKLFWHKGRNFVWWKNVFLLAVQICYRLGFKDVFCVGTGFKISEDKQYAYDTKLTPDQVLYNQRVYDGQIRQLRKILDGSKDHGFKLFSSTQDSKLNDILEYVDVDAAIQHAEKVIPSPILHGLDHPEAYLKRKKGAYKHLEPKIGKHYVMGEAHRTAILDALPEKGRMWEYGSGDSTLWFRHNLGPKQGMISVEHDPYYAKKAGAEHIVYDAGKGATPDVEKRHPGWEMYTNAIKSRGKFDVILVDGVLRNECLRVARHHLKSGGRIFLHDAQRDWYEAGKKYFKWVKDYPSQADYPGPTLIEGVARG